MASMQTDSSSSYGVKSRPLRGLSGEGVPIVRCTPSATIRAAFHFFSWFVCIFRLVVVVDIFGIFVELLDLLFLRSLVMIENHLLKFGSVTGLMVP